MGTTTMSLSDSLLGSSLLSFLGPIFWKHEAPGPPYSIDSLLEEPSPNFHYLCHPLVDKVSKEVDDYFLEHWPFPNEKARRKFLDAGFSKVTCLYCPQALDDRIQFACRMLTILFLMDDALEYMSFEDGSAYNENFMSIARGDKVPDRSIPGEYMWHDLWESMRNLDREMANDMLEPTFTFMKAQVDSGTRTKHLSMGEYYAYREKDVGKALLAALMRFAMELKVTPVDLENALPLDKICAKHISIMNDVWSFKKEVITSKTAHKEGGVLCNSVQLLADEADISTCAAQRVLLRLCREWELRFISLSTQVRADPEKSTPELVAYLKGLEYQMSGNEQWSKNTGRYNNPK